VGWSCCALVAVLIGIGVAIGTMKSFGGRP
jgi:hypothetical protein